MQCADECDVDTGGCETCPEGKYGDDCDDDCSLNCAGACDKQTGRCDNCVDGMYGDGCGIRCPNGCLGPCDRTTSDCDSCDSGLHGDKCSILCSSDCVGGCDQDSSKCNSCLSGIHGDLCNKQCGDNCITCTQTVGCTQCEDRHYGETCDYSCPTNCDGNCAKSNGDCLSCDDGYYGFQCRSSCGGGCQEQCQKDNGYCTCISGWTSGLGKYCNQCVSHCVACDTTGCTECATGYMDKPANIDVIETVQIAVQKLVENVMAVMMVNMAGFVATTVGPTALSVTRMTAVLLVRLGAGAKNVCRFAVVVVRLRLATKIVVIALAKRNGQVISVIGA